SAFTAIDFIFKQQIAATLKPNEIGPFLATVYLGTNVASLIAQAIGVGALVRWLGVHRALYVMPFLLTLGAGAAAAGAGVAIIALRGVAGALRPSLHKTSSELLFVPIPDSLRQRAKPIVDLLGQRGGQAVASVAILGLATLLPRHAALAVSAAILA